MCIRPVTMPARASLAVRTKRGSNASCRNGRQPFSRTRTGPDRQRPIGQPHNGANARRRHQEPRAGIALRQLAHLFVKTVQFLKQDRMHSRRAHNLPAKLLLSQPGSHKRFAARRRATLHARGLRHAAVDADLPRSSRNLRAFAAADCMRGHPPYWTKRMLAQPAPE